LTDNRGVIRSGKSLKDRHNNDQKKKRKRTNNDLQITLPKKQKIEQQSKLVVNS
jgi:hypothetical protein